MDRRELFKVMAGGVVVAKVPTGGLQLLKPMDAKFFEDSARNPFAAMRAVYHADEELKRA